MPLGGAGRALLLGLAALTAGAAQARHYVLRPFQIPLAGATAVSVTVLNRVGDYGGTYQHHGRRFAYAVIDGRFRTLPPIPGADPRGLLMPTAITPGGEIGGVYGYGDIAGFVYRGGAYAAPIEGPDGYNGTLGRNDAGDTFLTVDTGHGETASALGRGSRLAPFAPRLGNGGSTITSLNARGDVAGFGQDGDAFACIAYRCAEIAPRGAVTASFGTFIDDRGRVAGVADGAPFLFADGMFRRFALPRGESDAVLGGFSDTGTLAGTASAPGGRERVFTLRDGRFAAVGDYRGALVFGVTDGGDVGVAIAHGRAVRYFLAICGGGGC